MYIKCRKYRSLLSINRGAILFLYSVDCVLKTRNNNYVNG